MHGISETMERLTGTRGGPRSGRLHLDRLHDVAEFGFNPGALGARAYVPAGLAPGAPLVVVLHGCTQSAAGYDEGSGWSTLADEAGFALLFPQQQRANNANLCFNWFEPADIGRDGGEARSIRSMVEHMVATHGLDRSRIFVTGLSAGGAMTAVMLATHPELFAGGAVIAGLPYASASSVPEAFERMRGQEGPDAATLARRAQDASGHRGPWPTLSVWHGSTDRTVAPSNADTLVAVWAAVTGEAPTPSQTSDGGRHSTQTWLGPDGQVRIERHAIEGMGHGTPIAGDGLAGSGRAAPFMLDVGVASTRRIAAGWGIAPFEAVARTASNDPDQRSRQDDARTRRPAGARTAQPGSPHAYADERAAGITRTIEGALRAAGLLR